MSSIPATISSGFIPILGSAFGASLVNLGVFFFLMRMGVVVGSIMAPKLHENVLPHKIGVSAEFANFFIVFLILFSIAIKSTELFVICAFFKGVISGSILILRFSWLKKLPDFQKSSHLNLIANVLAQSAYALVGVFLFIAHSLFMAKMILIADAIGSLLGAWLFWSLRKYSVISKKEHSQKFKNMFLSLISTPERRVIFITDILVCCGMGGANIMLYKYGEVFFGKENGYAIALILYGFFFYLGGRLIQEKNKGKSVTLNVPIITCAILFMVLSLLLLPLAESTIIKMLLLTITFSCYPMICLQIQSEWFKLCKPHEASVISSAEMIYSQMIFGVFEFIYSVMSYDNLMRAIFFMISCVVVLMYPLIKKSKKIELI